MGGRIAAKSASYKRTRDSIAEESASCSRMGGRIAAETHVLHSLLLRRFEAVCLEMIQPGTHLLQSANCTSSDGPRTLPRCTTAAYSETRQLSSETMHRMASQSQILNSLIWARSRFKYGGVALSITPEFRHSTVTSRKARRDERPPALSCIYAVAIYTGGNSTVG